MNDQDQARGAAPAADLLNRVWALGAAYITAGEGKAIRASAVALIDAYAAARVAEATTKAREALRGLLGYVEQLEIIAYDPPELGKTHPCWLREYEARQRLRRERLSIPTATEGRK